MAKKDKLVVFEGNAIRRLWHNEEWYYSVIDIVTILTESPTPRQYWGKVKNREFVELELSPIWVQLKLKSSDGKLRLTDCANTQNMFRIIQSIPSKKAEPFKQWLAQVGYERVEEIEDPEKGYDRIRSYYEMKGYPKSWIDKRLQGMDVRQELTQEWRERDVDEGKEFAILTNEISKATFGKTVGEYKEFKGLQKPKQNLRDHMNNWELILTMVGEQATTDITKEADAQGFEECKGSAQDGGQVAADTRKSIEKRLGRPVISQEGVLPKKKNKRIK